jgi:putative hydrolase of the HAD superfamily
VVEQVFDDVPSAGDALFEDLWRHFSRPEHWRLYEDVAECWRALSDLGCAVAIASNFDARLVGICRGLPPLGSARHLLWSADLGHSKPSAAFYREAVRRLEASLSDVIMVGDDARNDYHGALAAGWNAVLLDRAADHSSPTVIRSLRELPERLAAAANRPARPHGDSTPHPL